MRDPVTADTQALKDAETIRHALADYWGFASDVTAMPDKAAAALERLMEAVAVLERERDEAREELAIEQHERGDFEASQMALLERVRVLEAERERFEMVVAEARLVVRLANQQTTMGNRPYIYLGGVATALRALDAAAATTERKEQR